MVAAAIISGEFDPNLALHCVQPWLVPVLPNFDNGPRYIGRRNCMKVNLDTLGWARHGEETRRLIRARARGKS